ncbi:succinate-semialdehyde dehydrogenase/glutarate-semialdehyde dehydrogenase [Pseudomonas citronellolis]|uniref:NAD-dependent succinate-semialdehyde dehydrogenase n=1 Tax=Pseudomonas citronellolis TaxID=53408 RepID=UPI0020A0F0A3|nr:NAD-dependent succinate-semialdehyde dehydrogenase [Pseudomonas citronellolis]MCP1645004.1 succinate-semialdehyde dehydrogenase/glutarate-semialdehyde dehydrogenase [Pseudomonas citronellolis]MCP1667996.1 succinate-semialdehyde dehydrogenase/glutarate-semialdehyde dehydrogenase [Pseudomonas citronellolis]MCP1699158.1 succinate-semialdehyde dehydrogenase/glutarate-semialdehyde dehydrogenase [Pseudomonas citronellolis]MCP1705689.1 succinate-semialdehyde dehydrogenase/glutarate-semialdehyde deh
MNYSQFIAGEFRQGQSESRITVFNPSNGNPLGTYACADQADIHDAIRAAASAFATWKKTSIVERSGILRRAAALIRDRADAFAERIALELGKPLGEGRKEVATAAEMFEWAAEEARRLYGRTIPARTEDVSQTVVWEPKGPVAAFSGWNAPAITPARKISGALAAGCTIVIKPSEETAGVALLMARALADAGVPDGVVNMVFGDPAEIAHLLCSAPEISMITFTGATAVGKELGAKAAQSLKGATLELGGHAPVIICDDVDVDRIATAAVMAKFRNAGQVCTSPTRFLVQRRIFEEFTGKFVRATESLRLGDPFAPEVQMGPLKNPRRVEALQRLVEDARARGCQVLTGGERVGSTGCFFKPTVILQPSVDSLAAQVEPFGPLALISSFENLDEAIAEANRLPFGLAAYAFTNHLGNASRLAMEIDSGVVCINEWQASLPETPFGGHKDSGLGSEGGIEGIQAFLNMKLVRQGPRA